MIRTFVEFGSNWSKDRVLTVEDVTEVEGTSSAKLP